MRRCNPEAPAAATGKATFPSGMAVLARLHAASGPLTATETAAGFRGIKIVPRVDGALRALARPGYAQPTADGRAYAARWAA